jgi:uncharacterized membrane protein YfcA
VVDPLVLHVIAVVFLATVIRSAFGFGEALVAVPLLALRIPVQVAAPVAVLVSITVAAIVMIQDWREVHVRSAGWLVAGTLSGVPVGLWLLTGIDQQACKAVLALLIILFAIYSLAHRAPWRLQSDRLSWLLGSGFVAGVLGGAYGMNGPPLVIYGSLRRWSAAQFRATLHAYFLPASMIGMAGYWLAGLWVPLVTRYYLFSLPGCLLATLIGRALNRRLSGGEFLRYAYVGLVVVGFVLLIQTFATYSKPRGVRRHSHIDSTGTSRVHRERWIDDPDRGWRRFNQ